MKAVEILGKENVPSSGVLVLPNRLDRTQLNHLTRLFNQRTVVFLKPDGAVPPAGSTDVIPLPPPGTDNTETIQVVKDAITKGHAVVVLPPETRVHPATLCTLPEETLTSVFALGTPVLPLFVECRGETCLSVDPNRGVPSTVFCFGELLVEENATPAAALEQFFLGQERCFSGRDIVKANLVQAVIAGLKKHAGSAKVIDGMDGSELPFDRLLAAAIAFSKHLKAETDKDRIGIILPPGKGAFVANLAALLAGKTPVNLNFTAGQKAIDSAVRQADIDKFVTADPFVRKMQSFPWPPNRKLVFIERVLPGLKKSIVKWAIVSKLLPAGVLCKVLRVPSKGGRQEAALLFTSGSSGEPKGVVLSHRNILANVAQFSSRLQLPSGSSLLGCLPIFHSFGYTVTLFYPMIEGVSVVTYPSPLDATKLAPLIGEHKITLLLSTPTFLRGYLRRVKKEDLAPVRYVITGAEKLPKQVAENFKEKFGKEVLEGYGLTETSPVTNFNLPDPKDGAENTPVIPSERPGSVGQVVPGLAVRICDPETDAPLPLDASGMIWFKGANVFEGYLNEPAKTEAVLQDGWFRTGDIGRVDHQGFLYIEGRLSRFSKISGEMVPHETMEAHISKALGLDGEEERKIAVVGLPDDQKGEQLVLLSTVAGETYEQELIDLRYTLLEAGIPSLWIPKKLIPVREIPLLASGKLDIKGCETLARQGA